MVARIPSAANFPSTRYMGSKQKVLDFIWSTVENLTFHSMLDAFSGSACVSYLFKTKGKQVYSNDHLHFCYYLASALIANNETTLSTDDIGVLLASNPSAPTFIQDTFEGLYFSDEDNRFLDETRSNINLLTHPFKRSLALSALVRACLKKRPRGIFAYTGHRYDDNRRDIQLSLREHFQLAVSDFNQAVFSNEQNNQALNEDVFELDVKPDLVYFDPPYYSPRSDSDYLRRYHFVEGLVRYWDGVKIQQHTKTKKLEKYETDFNGRASTYAAFPRLFHKFQDSIIVVSYSSNSLPSKDELLSMLRDVKGRVDVYEIDYKYSFGTQYAGGRNANDVQEYIFIGT